MKKLVLFIFLAGSISFAQAGNTQPNDLKNKATEVAREMMHTLELNEHEYLKVKTLTMEKLTRLAELSQNYSNDMQLLEQKTTEAELAYQKQLQHILNHKQLDSYLSLYANPQE